MVRDIRAVFSANGLTAAFYDATVDDPARIPAGAVAIAEADWLAFLAGGLRWNGSKLVTYAAPAQPAPVPAATPYQITLALNLQGGAPAAAFDAALGKAKPSDRMRWNARTDPIPEDNPVYVRLCGLAGLDPAPLHARAVQQ